MLKDFLWHGKVVLLEDNPLSHKSRPLTKVSYASCISHPAGLLQDQRPASFWRKLINKLTARIDILKFLRYYFIIMVRSPKQKGIQEKLFCEACNQIKLVITLF
jgi:hypothetical protein